MIFMPSFFDILSFRDILFERESELVSSGGSFILRFLYSNMQVILDKKLILLIIGKFSFCDVQDAVQSIHKQRTTIRILLLLRLAKRAKAEQI